MASSIDPVERLTNLVALLLQSTTPLTLDEIVERLPGYPEGRASYRRLFERDKDLLRDLGVPITIIETDQFGTGTVARYRIQSSDYYLPHLDLADDERAALNLAVAAVRLEGGEGREAMWKLGGIDGGETDALASIPGLDALPALFEAHRIRAVATFTYRAQVRHLEPWALVFRNGHWYVSGRDVDRDAQRSFRVDRIETTTPAVTLGAPASFDRPDTLDLANIIPDEPWKVGDDDLIEARLLIDAPQAFWVEAELGEEAVIERRDGGAIVVRLAVTNRDAFRSFVLGMLDHAEVLAPAALRADVIEWLDTLVALGEPTSSRIRP